MAGRYNPQKHHRRSLRLQGYDYSGQAYFVTMCTRDRDCIFGNIVNGEIRLNGYGEIVYGALKHISQHMKHVELDYFIVMPNHIHVILNIARRGGGTASSNQGGDTPPLRLTLGQIVAYYKYQTTKQINKIRNTPGIPLWQRNYYEHIIRNETEINRIRQYIIDNPLQWDNDQNNPVNII